MSDDFLAFVIIVCAGIYIFRACVKTYWKHLDAKTAKVNTDLEKQIRELRFQIDAFEERVRNLETIAIDHDKERRFDVLSDR